VNEVMIQVELLCKSFGTLKVLENISTQVRQGEVVAVIGPSGSGKSTLLRCMNLLETPTQGHVYYKGLKISAPKANIAKIRQQIGMVFQNFHLFPHMTVLQNITYAPMKVKHVPKTQAHQKALELLDRVGLAEKAAEYPARLSGGQKQRVAIARCLAMEPEMILFDEPTSALDPEMVKEVLEVIQGLATTGITMAIVTHEMAFAREVAHRILFLDGGCLAEDAPPSQFFTQPQCIRAQQFLEKML
jgi:arginine/lysine/histidine transport system ATP-binding protein